MYILCEGGGARRRRVARTLRRVGRHLIVFGLFLGLVAVGARSGRFATGLLAGASTGDYCENDGEN